MEKLKRSLAVKVAAFILMVICGTLTVFAAIVTMVNIDNGWYSQDKEDVISDIYYETAWKASDILSEEIWMELSDEDEDRDRPLSSAAIELIDDENSSREFGYTITAYDGAKFGIDTTDNKATVIRQVNKQLQGKDGVYERSFEHDSFKIDVYLGESLDSKAAAPSEIVSVYSQYNSIYDNRSIALAITIIGFIAALSLFIFLLTSAGKRRDVSAADSSAETKVQHSFIGKIPMDVVTAVAAMLIMFTGYTGVEYIATVGNYDVWVMTIILGTSLIITLMSGYILLFAVQVRIGSWWRSTLIYQILRVLRFLVKEMIKLFKTIPLMWKTSLILAVCLITNFFIMIQAFYYLGGTMLIWLVGAALITVVVLYSALCLRKLKEGGKHLAEGDLEYQIDKKGLFLDFADHADDLNSIAQGMSKAVNEKMKSERFKTELITNVSHDIKTPLTSIINYVDFLKSEDIDNEKAKEYIDVIDRQSQRLRKLTEDIVEASKVATGNIKMDIAPCQVGVLMTQSMGEYEEKAKAANIDLIINLPDEEIEIMADGRYMWRVFDNLLNNICKYTQSQTRVYQTLERKGNKAVITYKNISKYELNITGEELMERFVRGDSSRHTDGSGLGLSIAQNLIEAQGGSFRIDIDGDLFKVTIEFTIPC